MYASLDARARLEYTSGDYLPFFWLAEYKLDVINSSCFCSLCFASALGVHVNVSFGEAASARILHWHQRLERMLLFSSNSVLCSRVPDRLGTCAQQGSATAS